MNMVLGIALAGLLAGLQVARAQSAAAAPSPAVEFGLIGIFAAGGSSANDDTVATLQGGGHDPNRNGFTVQAVELTATGTVDPYFDAQVNVVLFTDPSGELNGGPVSGIRGVRQHHLVLRIHDA